jgi:hypothetical protein
MSPGYFRKENLMNLRIFLIIASILALVYAAGLILMPAFMNSTYGFGGSASEILLSRFFGVELLVLGLISWLAKDMTGSSVGPIITGNLIGNAVGTVVAFTGTISGVMNAAGWSAVAIYLLLTVGFAYFQFMAPVK